MRKVILPVLVALLVFVSCNNDDETSTLETESNCLCENETEYICWKLNGVNQSANPVGKVVTDVLLSQGYINFGDNGSTNFYFEYEDFPVPLQLNTLYQINSSTSSDYDIGFDGTSDIDTLFISASIKFTENTTSHIKGEFSAWSAITRNDLTGETNSIDLAIENGCFKLLK